MNLKKIPIDQLKIGMYLVGVDVSWMKTPFVKHRFMIDSQKKLQSLEGSGIKFVEIDIDKSAYDFDLNSKQTIVPSEPTIKKIKPNSLSKEINFSKNLESQSKRQMKVIFDTLKTDKKADIKGLLNIVSQSNDSILRNGQALLSLFHANKRGDILIDYAFNTMSLALLMGQRMDISDQELLDLGTAALMMDVGWLMLPTQLFQQPYPYSDSEFDLVKQHPDLSVDLLEASNFDSSVVGLVAKHHEHIDGSGYYSYTVEDIPLAAQILSLADHYSSQVMGCYDGQKIIPATALRNIYKKISDGSHDAGLVELLVQLLGIFPISSAVQLNTQEKAIVTKVNWRDALKPTISIFYNKSGEALMKPKNIDLFKQNESQVQREIKKVLNPLSSIDDPAGILVYSI